MRDWLRIRLDPGDIIRLAPLMIAVMSLTLGCAGPAKEPAAVTPVVDLPRSLLIDSIHAHNALDQPEGDQQFSYHHVYGMRRGLAYLRAQGFAVAEAKTGRLTPDLLRRHRMLLINLVSADLPPFYVEEIRAIKEYLEAGGNVFVIIDHSNCYFHNHKIAPLLEELGIRSHNETACERPPETLGSGSGWIAVTRFAEHPVTRGLKVLGMQTAGTIDERYAVAITSSAAWGDLWTVEPYGEGTDPGHYGNWNFDAGERVGPLGLVLAREIGQGRIVVVTDQNCLSDPFLHYADNYKLFLNAMGWLMREETLGEAAAYVKWTGPRVVLYDDARRTTFASTAGVGYYHAMAALGRHLNVFAGEDLSDAEVIVLAHPDYDLRQETMAKLTEHLRSGRSLVILDPRSGRQGVVRILEEQLGKSEDEPAGDSVVRRFAGGGRIVLCTGGSGYNNMQLAGPNTKPTEEQRRTEARLVGILKGQMKGK